MRRSNLNVVTILDASAQRVRRVAAPWMGVLWLAILPSRLCLVFFWQELARLDEPSQYLFYLLRLALLYFAALLPAYYGRAVFVRACYLNHEASRSTGASALRVPARDFIPYLYSALLCEVFFDLSFITFILPLVMIVAGGLAAGQSYAQGKSGLWKSPAAVLGLFRHFWTVVGVTAVFAFALLLATIGVFMGIQILLWLGAPLLGSSLPRWERIFAAGPVMVFAQHELTGVLIFTLATMLVEPFWLAANVELVQRSRARKTGEDLRLWFDEIRAEDRTRAAEARR